MKLLRARQASVAAGRRNGNSSRLPLPEPTLAAMPTTVAWEAMNDGHDVDQTVGAWCGAHAFLRRGELARTSWEWVTSDGSGNPDRTAIVLHPVEESRSVKTKEYDETVLLWCVLFFGYVHCVSPGAASLACRKSFGKLFTERVPSSESLLSSGNKCHTYCDTREPPQMPGPGDGR